MIRKFLRAVYRHVRLLVIIMAIAVAVALVTVVTIDLGPWLRVQAERGGSSWLDRPMHIGRLRVHIARGRFIIEDLRVDGLTPDAEPWLVAKRVDISLTWRALVGREVLLDTIEMTDWRMLVETFSNGRHTFPRVTGPPRAPSTAPRLVVTTLQYVRAHRGEFVLRDHGAPWGVVARNIDVTVSKLVEYRGTAKFTGGTVTIQQFEPMSADMTSSFKIQNGLVLFDRIDLRTDGAVSAITGSVDLARWPEQTYQVKSRIQLPRMRELFWAREAFSFHGESEFSGTFHLFKGGRELKGAFRSAEAGFNDWRFPDLEGSLVWLPDRFEVTRASAGLHGGRADFRYALFPLGRPGQRARATFDVDYTDVDLNALTDFLETSGLRVAGRGTGVSRLAWSLGNFAGREGSGEITVAAPPGVFVQGRELDRGAAERARERARIYGPFSRHTPLAPVGIAGRMVYTFDGDAIRLGPSEVATAETYIGFEGATAWGERSKIGFRVTSADWQESDRLLAGLMTAFGAPTLAIPIDGIGRFEGVMLGAFRRPRIEGRLVGEEMRAWEVTWGSVDGDFVIDNAYANVSRAVLRSGASRIDVSGQFSLGYPRRDGGEEIDARVRVDGRPVADFLEAFDLQDYDVSGTLSGDFHLYGPYTRPFGFGRLAILNGTAYGEAFSEGQAGLRFEGNGVRLDAIEIHKGGGVVAGAAYVGWNGTYSFNADGRRINVDTLALTAMPGYPPLTGLLEFTVGGSATFESPRYDVRFGIHDLFLGDEGIGEVTGRLSVRDALMTYEVEAASTRLAVSGTGRIALTDERDAELSFRVTDTSLDPYVRALFPGFSSFTSAVVSGGIRVVGELGNPDALRVDAAVDQVNLRFFDYALHNDGPIRLAVDRQVLRVEALRLAGEDTQLDLIGEVNLPQQTVALTANGSANLAVLQGFLPNVRSSGQAEVSANVSGRLDAPVVSGTAFLSNGRLRDFAFPHALENLNGIVTFNASGIRLDGVSGRLGGGDVRFGGRIGLAGYRISEFDVTATGRELRLRFPEGMRSTVNATLALQGPFETPVLSGEVQVLSSAYTRTFEASANVFGLGGDEADPVGAAPSAAPQTAALRLDVRIVAPSTLRIQNEDARIVAGADLNLRGTVDRPLLFGRAEIQRGEAQFEGRRYLVTRGSLDFTNPDRIQPFFDIEAETRVRVPRLGEGGGGQTYRVTLRMAGTTERLQPEFTSDPPLPPLEILSLLFSDAPTSTGDVELTSLRPDDAEQRLLEARATRALTGTLSAEVGKVVERTFGVDTFQITPLLSDPYQQSSRLTVNPSARITIGQRISDRIYLTYARSLSSTRDEIILLEFDQSDSLAWVLSQNEDRTYTLEFRKRHTF
jgi:hypothetical protein